MTDPTPTTEAGRRLLEVLRAQGTTSIAAFGPADILAIEAEAAGVPHKVGKAYYEQGRADALREAAERVSDPAMECHICTICSAHRSHVGREHVLAILTEAER